MAPFEPKGTDALQQHRRPLCAFRPLPLSPTGVNSHVFSHLHCLLCNALREWKRSLELAIRQAIESNPLLFRFLPPQVFPRQVGGFRRKPHHLAACNFAAVFPSDSVAAMVASNGVVNFLNIYNTMLIVRLLLTWFPNPPQIILNPLSTICDPYLNIFRGIIPPLGGTIDLSPLLAFFVLNIFTNTAAALPAEMSHATLRMSDRQVVGTSLTWSQKAWLKRQSSATGSPKGKRQNA